jgi:hypothetical protein
MADYDLNLSEIDEHDLVGVLNVIERALETGKGHPDMLGYAGHFLLVLAQRAEESKSATIKAKRALKRAARPRKPIPDSPGPLFEI